MAHATSSAIKSARALRILSLSSRLSVDATISRSMGDFFNFSSCSSITDFLRGSLSTISSSLLIASARILSLSPGWSWANLIISCLTSLILSAWQKTKNVFNTLRSIRCQLFTYLLMLTLAENNKTPTTGQGHPTRSIFATYLFANDLRSRIFGTFVVTFLGNKNVPISTV